MQFNHEVTIQFATAFDEYADPTNTTSQPLKCRILSENLAQHRVAENSNINKTKTKRKNQYDMVLLVKAKTYAPYSRLFDDNMITIIKGGRSYEIVQLDRICSTGGKPKYFQISLTQVHK